MIPVHMLYLGCRLSGHDRVLLLVRLLREELARDVRGQVAVRDRAGELDRRLRGLYYACGLMLRLWVRKTPVFVGQQAWMGELGGLGYAYPFLAQSYGW
jgi:hypothetical protein